MSDFMVVLRLTRSQQMALADIVLHYALLHDQPQKFVDCSSPDCVITTTGDLLALLTDLRELEVKHG